MHRIVELPVTEWSAELDPETSRGVVADLELGKVLYLPRLAFPLSADEAHFLDPRWLSGTHKSVSYEPDRARDTGGVRGARGSLADLQSLAAMIGRFRAGALRSEERRVGKRVDRGGRGIMKRTAEEKL